MPLNLAPAHTMPKWIKGTDTLYLMFLQKICTAQLVSPDAILANLLSEGSGFSTSACSHTHAVLQEAASEIALLCMCTSMTAGAYSAHPTPDICVGIEPGQGMSSGSYVIRVPYAPAGSHRFACFRNTCFLIAC